MNHPDGCADVPMDDMPHKEWLCTHCNAGNSHLDAECQFCDFEYDESEYEE